MKWAHKNMGEILAEKACIHCKRHILCKYATSGYWCSSVYPFSLAIVGLPLEAAQHGFLTIKQVWYCLVCGQHKAGLLVLLLCFLFPVFCLFFHKKIYHSTVSAFVMLQTGTGNQKNACRSLSRSVLFFFKVCPALSCLDGFSLFSLHLFMTKPHTFLNIVSLFHLPLHLFIYFFTPVLLFLLFPLTLCIKVTECAFF